MPTNTSNITQGKEHDEGFLRGMKVAYDVARVTYGPNGLNAIIQCDELPFNKVSNDFETIIQSIFLKEPTEKQALDLFKSLVSKATTDSGNGRKTTSIIAYSILEQCYAKGLKGMKVKRELDKYIDLIEHNLHAQKKTITEDEVGKVARIAGESETLGTLLGDIYKVIGKDGIIHIEGSGSYETSYKVIDGIRFASTGYLSPQMASDSQADKEGRASSKAVYDNPIILVTKRKIEKIDDIDLLVAKARLEGRPLVIFTDDMDSNVGRTLIANHTAGVAKILIIKAPTLWKNYVFEDFALVTGSTIVEDSTGINFKNIEHKHLGTCAQIVVDSQDTVITGGKDISLHKATLRAMGDTDSKLRLSWLTTKTALLKLGSNNEEELFHYRLKCADAISSCQRALRSGVVEGGGVALVRASLDIKRSDPMGQIVYDALQLPRSIIESDTTDVFDAYEVTANSVRNALAMAGIILSGGLSIVLPEKTPEMIAAEVMRNKGMRF